MNKLLTAIIFLLVIIITHSPTPPVYGSVCGLSDTFKDILKDKEGRGGVENVLYTIEDDMAFWSINTHFLKDIDINYHPFSIPNDPYREDLHGQIECSCVRYARSLGLPIPYNTNAINLKPNTEISLGVGALFSEEQGHVAVVVEILEDGFWVDEGDYKKCERTKRFIKFDNPYNKLIGFYKP